MLFNNLPLFWPETLVQWSKTFSSLSGVREVTFFYSGKQSVSMHGLFSSWFPVLCSDIIPVGCSDIIPIERNDIIPVECSEIITVRRSPSSHS